MQWGKYIADIVKSGSSKEGISDFFTSDDMNEIDLWALGAKTVLKKLGKEKEFEVRVREADHDPKVS